MKNSFAMRCSFWASRNRPLAIAFIIFGKVYIGTTGLLLGAWAALDGFVLPGESIWALVAIALFAFAAYPAKRLKCRLGGAGFYRRQKSVDGLLAGLGLAVMFFAGNHAPGWVARPYVAADPIISTQVASLKTDKELTMPETSAEVSKNLKERRTAGKFKKWLVSKAKKRAERALNKLARQTDGMDIVGKVLLSLLLLVGAFLVAYGVAILACSIACSGQEAMAALVAAVGGTGIIVGLIFAFKAIWYDKENDKIDTRHQKKRPPTSIED